jgi:predicted transcriptional regulator
MTDSTESQTDSSEKLSESGMMTKDSNALGRGSDVYMYPIIDPTRMTDSSAKRNQRNEHYTGVSI